MVATTRPSNQNISVFDKQIRGFYGEFKSDKSYPLAFVQSVLPIEDIRMLKTTSEAFSTKSLDFEELIQRDIDHKRVREIADLYLKKGEERVLFFPPLLVSLIAIDDEQIIPTFESVKHEKDSSVKEVKSTWGGDRFQLLLPYDDEPTGFSYSFDSDDVNSNPYWSILKINSKRLALVVIDGQHRLSALKYLLDNADPDNRNTVRDISVPICVVFSAQAIKESTNSETINRDLRELFVRINTTSREVSGHFTILLSDKKLSSIAIRSFCDKSKVTNIDGLSFLNLIEWNQRESKISSKINRKYSVTTIQVISDTLSTYIFEEKKGGKTRSILNLDAHKESLEKNGDLISSISESNFTPAQIDTLRDIISDKLSGALVLLFFNPRPYKEVQESFKKSVGILNDDISKGINGAKYFKESILGKFRDSNIIDSEEAKVSEKRFIDNIIVNSNDKPYFSNTFQQGLIRVWAELSVKLSKYGLTPNDVANALIEPLNLVCFNKEYNLFDPERMYSQKIIYNGQRYIVTDRAKSNWYRLIFMSFINDRSRDLLVTNLRGMDISSDQSDFDQIILEISKGMMDSYFEDFYTVVFKDYEKNWREKEFSAQIMENLESINDKMKEGDTKSVKEFKEKITSFTDDKCEEAKAKFTSLLMV